MPKTLRQTRCPALDYDGRRCLLQADHPGEHSVDQCDERDGRDQRCVKAVGHDGPHNVSSLMQSWVPVREVVCPHCGGMIELRRTQSCSHCGGAISNDGGIAVIPGPPEARARHIVSLAVGALLLVPVYHYSLFFPEPSGPAERTVLAMTIGPVILVIWTLAAGLGWYGIAGIASFMSQSRKDGGLWATIAVIGWFVASCAVPVAI